MNREILEFDVVIVGAGPAGLSAACRLAQLSRQSGQELSIVVVDKGAEVGSHIVSGAVVDPRALTELFPDWRDRNAPLDTPVVSESFAWLRNPDASIEFPQWLVPRSLSGHGLYIASLGRLCRWLAQEAEALGCDLLTGFAANELLVDEQNRVCGVATSPHGIRADGSQKADWDPGYELHAGYVLLAEGCRGQIGREVEQRFGLREGRDPPHYGIGFKEVWELPEGIVRKGHIEHTAGWPLGNRLEGGGFVYHGDSGRISVGFVVALNYRNPWLDPFGEFQRFKQHPRISALLQQGRRIGFGARAVNKGGWLSMPRLGFPGGMLIGCDAGLLDSARMKGVHTAMKSGMLAADAVAAALLGEGKADAGQNYETALKQSWLGQELRAGRNFSNGITRFGALAGGALAFLEQNLLRGRTPFSIRNRQKDRDRLLPPDQTERIDYPQPDGVVSFDRLSSIHLANITHEEDQPCHLKLTNPAFDAVALRYCPAAVYEIVTGSNGEQRFQINAANCIHCKTCDIKDPADDIRWVAPEGGSGPNYAEL